MSNCIVVPDKIQNDTVWMRNGQRDLVNLQTTHLQLNCVQPMQNANKTKRTPDHGFAVGIGF